MNIEQYCQQEFGTLSDLVRLHAANNGERAALIGEDRTWTYAELDILLDRIAASFQRDGAGIGDVVAITAERTSAAYAAVFLGALRAGVVVAPLAPTSTPEAIAAQIDDCAATIFFRDAAMARHIEAIALGDGVSEIGLDMGMRGVDLDDWLVDEGTPYAAEEIGPDDGFNIIYSSGTTGKPKGIVHSHAMRWAQIKGGGAANAVTIVSTPLYSNTTLVSFLPTLGAGATAVLLGKFDVRDFLEAAVRHSATHAMLVPVQYARIMAAPDFDQYDLSAFQVKFSTSAPLSAELKRDIIARWPGALVEFYGMTEGGGACALFCHLHPDKLHTVGQPLPGNEFRLIDEAGNEVAPGEAGEIVGRSAAMMKGYHRGEIATTDAEWYSPAGDRFIRTGDMGYFDADGFLTLIGRKKDMIISGGFNIYPSDLEAELLKLAAVSEAAVVGAPSSEWGETPVAFVTLHEGASIGADDIRLQANARLGKTQRLSDVVIVAELPRSEIGKVLKRELAASYPPR